MEAVSDVHTQAFLRELASSSEKKLIPLVHAKLDYLLAECESTQEGHINAEIASHIRAATSSRLEVHFCGWTIMHSNLSGHQIFRKPEISAKVLHMLKGTSSTSVSARLVQARSTRARETANLAVSILFSLHKVNKRMNKHYLSQGKRSLSPTIQSSAVWPMELIQLYLEDACAGRTWVDSDLPETKAFIGVLLRWAGAKPTPQASVTAREDSDESSGDVHA
mgnify:CR=1 FL=1